VAFHSALNAIEESEMFTDDMIKRFLDYKWTQVWSFSRLVTLIYTTYVISIPFFHPWWYLFIWFIYQSGYEVVQIVSGGQSLNIWSRLEFVRLGFTLICIYA
jgi:hypothetical protein